METSATAPANPINGDLWYDTTNGKTYMYYNDGSSSQWIETAGTTDVYSEWESATGGINYSGGNVGIGVTAPTVELDVAGDIRTSGGVLFGTDTADANTLDDYEEGTFDPFANNTLLTGTNTLRAIYTKVGNLVHIDCRVTWTGSTGSSAAIAFTLPYAASNYGSSSNTGQVFYSGTAVFSGATLSTHASAGNSTVNFYRTNGGGFESVKASNVNGSYNWLFSFSYQV